MPNPPKTPSVKLTLVSKPSKSAKAKHPTPATSPALASFGSDLDLLSARAQSIIAGNVSTLLNEALAPVGVVAATKVDREAALIYVTTQVVNAVWQAASTAAQAMLPPTSGKTVTMRATPLGKPHKGCLRFFVCDADSSDGISTDARGCC